MAKFVLNNCSNYDPSCEAKDCCECEITQEAIKKYEEEYNKLLSDPEYQRYVMIPIDCLWGCTHCEYKGTNQCQLQEE